MPSVPNTFFQDCRFHEPSAERGNFSPDTGIPLSFDTGTLFLPVLVGTGIVLVYQYRPILEHPKFVSVSVDTGTVNVPTGTLKCSSIMEH